MASNNNNSNSRKKLDEYHIKVLREMAALPCNKNCFDCNQRGPTYVNVTIGSFVCTKCSGILRGLTPPSRVKSISMTTFTPEEIDMLRSRGNDYCRRVWLGLCDNSVQHKDEQQIKDFMIDKYEKKRYYVDPSTIPNLRPPVSQSSPQPPSSSSHHTKSIPLRTTQITHTNGSPSPAVAAAAPSPLVPPSTTTSSSSSSQFPADFQLAPRDPFSAAPPSHPQPATQQPQPHHQQAPPPTQPSFANFDNAVFSSVQPGIAGLPEAGRKQMSAPLEIPKEDKYAALKDLDLTMKQQQLGTTPTKPDSHNLNGDISSGSNGWPSGGGGGGLFGSPSGTALFPNTTTAASFPNATASLFPSGHAATYGASPNGFGGAAFGANGSMFSSNNSSMFGSPSTNGSLFGSPGGRSTDSPLTSGGGEVANPFGAAAPAANPFRSNLSSDMGWPSQAVPSSGSLMNGGFPISQSMDFSAKAQWPMVNHHIANPFKMNTAAPQTTAPHHSSNPFL